MFRVHHRNEMLPFRARFATLTVPGELGATMKKATSAVTLTEVIGQIVEGGVLGANSSIGHTQGRNVDFSKHDSRSCND